MKIEQKLSDAVGELIPKDMFERISEKIITVKEEGMDIIMPKKTNYKPKKYALLTAAACLLIAFGLMGVPYYSNNFVPDSIVDIDVNPSVEIVTNKNNKVLDVVASNADGEKILADMDLKNTELNVAVNAIIGSMVKNGYIIDEKSGILVSVQNEDAGKATQIRNLILSDIDASLNTNNVKASVINQTLTDPTDAKEFAKNNSISIGKAVFVMNLAAKESTLDAVALAKMSLRDIATLVVEKNIDIRDIANYDADDSIWENIADTVEDIDEGEKYIKPTEPQKPSEITTQPKENNSQKPTPNATNTDIITAVKAKEIALSHAGVAASGATFIKAELDTDDGVKIYEVEFYFEGTEYDYDINATTGAVVSTDRDIENYTIPKNNNSTPNTANTDVITAGKAKEIALSHAGVAESGATFIKAELDTDDGVKVYEVEFYSGRTEYDYEINATTSEIISAESEIDD